ncbi:MAG TPA: metallophosphoesterase [Candidatus Binatia bacterium]|nr:metallophosphoesterase [Candidatus Binatia bacterium]
MASFWFVPALGAATLTAVPLYARFVRGRSYARFGFVILAFSIPGLVVADHRLRELIPPASRAWIDALFAYVIAAAGAHLAGLVRARLRPAAFRALVSIPGMAAVAAGALSAVWMLALLPVRAALVLSGHEGVSAALAWLDLVPFAIVGLSLVTSLRTVEEIVRLPLDGPEPETLARLPVERSKRARPAGRPAGTTLRIVQIADPHLGPWQPIDRLHRRIDSLLDHDPDLVLLTGDFLTMEGAGTPGALAIALSPLRRARGRSFAIFGNHDHESPAEVRAALAANDVALLVDDEAIVETPAGPVQILGADYVGRGRRRQLERLFARFPRRPGHARILLLHDPSAFRHVPKDEVDLTLSGHTHGGQVGLVSLGVDWTVLKRSGFPDHGLFGHGRSRLYVHRGTGFYGFPLRIGVPGEASILEVVLRDDARDDRAQ